MSTNQPPSSKPTQSGITTNAETGERYIPSSLRADGSKRKEIKVRPGYRPPEDVELYKNRAAEAWKNRGRGGVPGAAPASAGIPGADGLKDSSEKSGGVGGAGAASNKNAKKREAKKKAKATNGNTQDTVTNGSGRDISQIENWRAAPAPTLAEKQGTDSAPVDPEVEQEKKARNLKKKLKQARELSDKKNQGEALLPEQLEKVIKIQELIRQLDSLGFDSNGDNREGTEEKPKE